MEVYHYISAKWGIEALRRKRLKLATLNDMNDPFELRPYNLSEKEIRKYFNSRRDVANSQVGFLCFCPTWKNGIMWSHYSDRHRGMVLGFQVSEARLVKIPYIEDRLDFIEESRCVAEGTSDFRAIQFAKHQSWAYERELRLTVDIIGRSSEGGLYFCDFSDHLKLSSVYLGERFSGSRDEIHELSVSQANKIEPIQTRLAFKSFEVVKRRMG
tara:strand:- start:14843 stop:15481 length:639 start_codon:yes stop_codon:yes gene_type:complete